MNSFRSIIVTLGLFGVIIFGAIGSSVYFLHQKQVADGTLHKTEQIPSQIENVNQEVDASISTVDVSAETQSKPAKKTTTTSSASNTLTQVAKHSSKTDCWLVISNKIYNVSTFLSSHPGGVSVITPFCGKDATTAFKTHGMSGGSNHSSYAYSLLPTYYVGVLNAISGTPTTSTKTATTPVQEKVTTVSNSARFSTGDRVKTISGVNVRGTASVSGSVMGVKNSGEVGTISGGPTSQGSYWWWKVNFDSGVDGWVVEDYLDAFVATQVPVKTVPVETSSATKLSDIATHNSQSNCWIVISNKVYNVTSFISSHPGGTSAIVSRCGTDATTAFTTSAGHIHSSYAYSLLPTYFVGNLDTTKPVTSDTQAPTVPTGLIATAMSSSQINLSWTASTDNTAVTGYKIYRGGVFYDTSSGTSYSNSNLSPSTAYSYTVLAYDASGNESPQSSSKSATTDALAVTPTPSNGTTFTTTQVATHSTQGNCWIIILGKVYNVTSFISSHPGGVSAIVSRCGTDATTAFTTSAGHAHSSYAYSLLPTYYVGDVGTGTVPVANDTTAPTVPIGLTATVISSSQINLSWTASTDTNGVSGYKIFRGGVQIGTSASINYSDTGLSASTAYSYTVSAYDANSNNSAQSTSKSATTQAGTPTPTSGGTYTTAEVTTHNVQTNCWIIILSKVYNVTSFISSHPGGVSAIRTRCGTDATTAFTTNAGHAHSSYAYSLLPTYFVGDLGTGTVQNGDTQAPTVPTNLSATAISSSQINLSWTASTDNTGVTGYRIYRNGTQLTTTTGTSYSNTGLGANTSYSYTVLAYDAAGNLSAQSTSASATTQAGTNTGVAVTYTVNVTSAGNYDVTNLTLNVGDKINFVYNAPRSGEVRTTFSPAGVSSVTIDSENTSRSRTFTTSGTWTFKAADHNGNQGTVVVQ